MAEDIGHGEGGLRSDHIEHGIQMNVASQIRQIDQINAGQTSILVLLKERVHQVLKGVAISASTVLKGTAAHANGERIFTEHQQIAAFQQILPTQNNVGIIPRQRLLK